MSNPKPCLLDRPRADHPGADQPSWRNSLSDWSWQRRQPQRRESENYYRASLAEPPSWAPLTEDIHCEVLVIGAGLLGASTALHLAESGVDTLLIEQDSVGASASGRNGGQLTPGLARWEAETMLQHFSLDEAKRLWRFTAQESMDLIKAIAERLDLELDLKPGHLTAAIHPGHLPALQQGIDARARLGDTSAELLSREALAAHVVTDAYHGAVLDSIGGHLHPLALNLGLVYGFVRNGGRVFEQTRATAIRRRGDGVEVITDGALIKAKRLVVAAHVSTDGLLEREARAAIPFYSYVAVTAPIEGGSAALMPTDLALYDTSLQIDYYRRVREDRLLFGGAGSGSRWSIEKASRYFEQRLRHLFPQQSSFRIDYLWSGAADLTARGATAAYCLEDSIYSVFGWSGHGVAQTVRIGKAISDAIQGRNDDFAMLCRIPRPPIPFGRRLAPMAIPIGSVLLELRARLQPSKLISF